MDSNDLKKQHCKPCADAQPPLSKAEAIFFLKQIPGWKFSKDKKSIVQAFRMKDFLSAIRFMQKIATVAQREDHHPDLHLTGYRNLQIELSTHSIGGLSLNDFIVAAKIADLPKKLKP